MTRLHRALVVAALQAAVWLAPPDAHGATPSPTATRRSDGPGFVLATGYDAGSEVMLRLELEDGSSQTLTANGGFWMSAGVAFLRIPLGHAAALDTVATLGFKYKSVDASNGGVRYLAFPLEVTERLALPPFRVGAGLSLALRPSYSGRGVLGDVDAEMDPSLGVLFHVEWIGDRRGREGWFVGARFIWQKLGFEGSGAIVDANAFGVAFGFET